MKKNKRIIIIFSIIIVCLLAVIITLSIMLLSKKDDKKTVDENGINTKEYEIESCVAGVDIPVPLELKKDSLQMNWYSEAIRIFFDSNYEPENSLANYRELFSMKKFEGKNFENQEFDSYCASDFMTYTYIFKKIDNLLVDVPNVMNDMENINNFFVVYENEYIKNIKNVTNKKYYQMENGMYVFYAEMDFDFIGYDNYHTLVLEDDEIKDYKVSMHGDVAFFTDTKKTYMMILGCNNNEFKEGECEAIIQNVKFTGKNPEAVEMICDKDKELFNIEGIINDETNFYKISYDTNKSLKIFSTKYLSKKYDNVEGYINSTVGCQMIEYYLSFYNKVGHGIDDLDSVLENIIDEDPTYYEFVEKVKINGKEFDKYIIYTSDKKFITSLLYLYNTGQDTICICARKDNYFADEVNEEVLEYYSYIEYCVEHTVLESLEVEKCLSTDTVKNSKYFDNGGEIIQVWDYKNDVYLKDDEVYGEFYK